MSLLAAHLEQISISCQGIDSLPFPPPKIFTNALLSNHDITSLIRDTETHERALFSVPPPPPPATSQNPDPPKPSSRRQTVFNVAGGEVTTGPPPNSNRSGPARRNTAVAAVLGGDLHAQIVRRGGQGAGDVDIEVLLQGAEKLCNVYPLPGALERIPAQRQKYAHQSNTLAYYEAKVAEQQEALERMNADRWADDEDEDENEVFEEEAVGLTEADLGREEEEVRELDRKKRELQARLRAIESDLGGLLRM
ncbi:reticulocyte-binding protein 2 a [Podospora aff. communis PSN243]|uniref:DASH complex subunit SPC34 n=1 Tax=Podospora aff. communis PSN243 TaxID=3040156 RepID=A0AAV9GK63_9PEZI|nr:reticulocyte-binding protein 2 a [Podospora aff. communis PSN243]